MPLRSSPAGRDGPIDFVLDFLPRMASASQVNAAMFAVRPSGRVVLMGGVGRAGSDALAIPYDWVMHNDVTIRGKWMYARDAIPRIVGLIRAGLIELAQFDLAEFTLDRVNDAIAHAAATTGPLKLTVLRPDG